jgi:hypothetical protein
MINFKFILGNASPLLPQIAPLLITFAILLDLMGQADALSPLPLGSDCSNANIQKQRGCCAFPL